MNGEIILRDYQLEAHHRVMTSLKNGRRRVLMTMPTGGGKTITFGSVIAKAVAAGGRALVLAHTEELVDQTVRTLKALLPGVSVGIVQAANDDVSAQVIVATVQTLRSAKRIHRIGTFKLIVIDEAHHSIADTYRGILDHVGAFTPGKNLPKVLGVTATPDRGDGKGLGDIFEEIVYEVSILRLIEAGYLSDIKAKRIILDLDLDSVARRGGDFADGALGEAMEDAGAPEHIAQAIKVHAADRKTIVFLPTVDMARKTAAAITAIGIRAESVDGTTPKDERRRIIDAVRSGELQVITNCMVLTEGFDAPVLDCAVMARPTSSRSLYQQSAGRVLRPYFGKDHALILDMVGVTAKHSLQAAGSLFSEIPEGEEIHDGETVTEAIERIQHDQVEHDRRGGKLLAIDVELFHRSNLNWTTSPGGAMVLTGMQRAYAIRTGHDDGCELFRLDPDGYDYQAVRMADDVPLDMARGMAEDAARSSGFDPGAHKHLDWRNGPVTDGQRRKLWMLGYRSHKFIAALGSNGAASNLIAGIQADNALAAISDEMAA